MKNYLNWKILVVDSAMQPIQIKSWTKALLDVILGKAEPVSFYEGVYIHSQRLEINLPSVIQIKRHCNYNMFPRFSRTNVFLRDNQTCQFCGSKEKMSNLTLDHVIPKSQGGPKTWTNIVTACKPCNHRKADRTPEQARMKLLRKPKKLQRLSPFFLKQNDPEDWKFYFTG